MYIIVSIDILVYRASKYDKNSMSNFFQNLEVFRSKLNTMHPTFVCGDFNINLDTNILDCIKKERC